MKPFWISKEQNEVWESFQGWMTLPTETHPSWQHIVSSHPTNSQCHLGENVIEDAGLHDEGETFKALLTQIQTLSGRVVLKDILHHPICDTSQLEQRIRAIQWVAQHGTHITKMLLKLRKHEPYLAWLMDRSIQEETCPFHLCFPKKLPFRLANHHILSLNLLHLFRGLIYPMIHTLSPVSSILGPYWVLRFKLRFPMPFRLYFQTMVRMALEGLRPGLFAWKSEMIKYIVVVGYILLYLYHIVQQWSQAKLLRTVRRQLSVYAKHIDRFLNISNQLNQTVPPWVWNAFNSQSIEVPVGTKHPLILLYKYGTQNAFTKEVLRNIGIIDVLQFCSRQVVSQQYILPRYDSNKATCLFGMGHPALGREQQRNPVRLDKNLIVTGPNAAGKSTYTRSILTNQLLGQTLGICCAVWGSVHPVGGIYTYMRIRDEVGTASLYEAELKRCSGILTLVEQNQDTDILCFLDEPFHSTPPMEGTATALAFIELLGSYRNTRLVATTHYHKMMTLEKEHPYRFQNVSMEAIDTGDRRYYFPYRLKRGASTQCIAIELLSSHGFPISLMESAIKWKKNIYAEKSNADET